MNEWGRRPRIVMGLRQYETDELWGPKGRNARPKAENYHEVFQDE